MLQRLVNALQVLAAPADEQLARCPHLVVKADELVLDCADALLLVADCPQLELTPEQQVALERVGDLLDRMSGPENAAKWTESALREAVEWQEMRRLARAALMAIGESVERPPPADAIADAIYVRGRDMEGRDG